MDIAAHRELALVRNGHIDQGWLRSEQVLHVKQDLLQKIKRLLLEIYLELFVFLYLEGIFAV